MPYSFICHKGHVVADLDGIFLRRIVDAAPVLRTLVFSLNPVCIRIYDGEKQGEQGCNIYLLGIIRHFYAFYCAGKTLIHVIFCRVFHAAVGISGFCIYYAFHAGEYFLDSVEGAS